MPHTTPCIRSERAAGRPSQRPVKAAIYLMRACLALGISLTRPRQVLMIPQEVLVVPMFILMQQLGWVNSYAALVLPWAFTAFGTFLLRQFFLSIPRELEEAAMVDGAGRIRVLLQIIVPTAKPAIAVLSVFTFINYWNSFLWPLIIVNTTEMATVPLGLNMFRGQQGNQWHLMMAASMISMLPSIVMLLLLQRHLVRGIALSGLGGR